MLLAVFLAFATAPAFSQPDRTVTKLADGVYTIEHKDFRDGIRNANTTVIIGERQVFVVDSGFMPSVAEGDIALIRQWTDKPVSFLLTTHFHNDHNFANRAYMDAFPALTIIAHRETKKSMDMFGPGSADREDKFNASLQKMRETGIGPDGQPLSQEDKNEVNSMLALRLRLTEEIRKTKFQSATLTFEQGFTVDLGRRQVQVMFLGRGNTAGDAVVFLPKEKIVMAGDLLSYPIPSAIDGYPSEWVHTLEKLQALEAETIIPGHGPVMHDAKFLWLVHDLLKSAVEQVDAKLTRSGPAFFLKLEEVRSAVDLSPFRERFAGGDPDLQARFDAMAANLVEIVYREAALR